MMDVLRSKKVLRQSGFIFLLSQFLILAIIWKSGVGNDAFVLQTTLDPEVFRQIVGRLSEFDLNVYLTHYASDFLHPFVYLIFLSACLVQTGQAAFLAFPVLAALCDQLENICQLWVFHHGEPLPMAAFQIGAWSARMKWVAAGISLVAIVVGILSHRIGREPPKSL